MLHCKVMTPNTESTRLDRLRMAVGTVLGGAGALTFAVEGVVFQFAHLPLTLAAELFIFAGLLIAGSHKLAALISGLLH